MQAARDDLEQETSIIQMMKMARNDENRSLQGEILQSADLPMRCRLTIMALPRCTTRCETRPTIRSPLYACRAGCARRTSVAGSSPNTSAISDGSQIPVFLHTFVCRNRSHFFTGTVQDMCQHLHTLLVYQLINRNQNIRCNQASLRTTSGSPRVQQNSITRTYFNKRGNFYVLFL